MASIDTIFINTEKMGQKYGDLMQLINENQRIIAHFTTVNEAEY